MFRQVVDTFGSSADGTDWASSSPPAGTKRESITRSTAQPSAPCADASESLTDTQNRTGYATRGLVAAPQLRLPMEAFARIVILRNCSRQSFRSRDVSFANCFTADERSCSIYGTLL
jgi:hypothetical protein